MIFAIVMVGCGFAGLVVAFVISAEEDIVERTYSNSKDFGTTTIAREMDEAYANAEYRPEWLGLPPDHDLMLTDEEQKQRDPGTRAGGPQARA